MARGGRGRTPTPRGGPDTVVAAIAFSLAAHGSQLRKDRRTPYIVHPVAVLRILSTELGVTDPAILAAGVLHDVLEDTPRTSGALRRRFGPLVTSLVVELTLPPALHGPEVPDSLKTRALVRAIRTMSWPAVLVKLADRTDNLRDSSNAGWSAGKRRAFREQSRRLLRALVLRGRADPPPAGLARTLAAAERLVVAHLDRGTRSRRSRKSSRG